MAGLRPGAEPTLGNLLMAALPPTREIGIAALALSVGDKDRE
jgi:hypothetical protein